MVSRCFPSPSGFSTVFRRFAGTRFNLFLPLVRSSAIFISSRFFPFATSPGLLSWSPAVQGSENRSLVFPLRLTFMVFCALVFSFFWSILSSFSGVIVLCGILVCLSSCPPLPLIFCDHATLAFTFGKPPSAVMYSFQLCFLFCFSLRLCRRLFLSGSFFRL